MAYTLLTVSTSLVVSITTSGLVFTYSQTKAFWAGDKQGEAILKSLITERPLMVEKKGVDTVQGVNRVKLGIASNMDWVVPASHDERRYAVTDIDNRYAMGEAPDEERKQY